MVSSDIRISGVFVLISLVYSYPYWELAEINMPCQFYRLITWQRPGTMNANMSSRVIYFKAT